jgi:hypothetical protein
MGGPDSSPEADGTRTTASGPEASSSSTAPPPSKTPMYEAVHAARYHRQEMVRCIEARTNRRLLCYVAGIAAPIERDDIAGFVDLLHNVPTGTDVDLLLHTGGGDTDAAEKLIALVRVTVDKGWLRVIVPDFAKSAGTLMALAADRIVMSATSELGPIDPQLIRPDSQGNLTRQSIQSYLDAYESHSAALRADPNDPVARLMLQKIDPGMLRYFEMAKERARSLAERHLREFMFQPRNGKPGNLTKTAARLIDTNSWLSHGQMIGWQAAEEMELHVEYLDPNSEAWLAYWRLYCLQRLAVEDRQKLFESNFASMVFNAKV